MKFKLTRHQQRILLPFIVALIVSLFGIGYHNTDSIGAFLERTQPGTYRVTEVTDGDTIIVDMDGRSEKVRFIGVDTPELHHPKRPVQCFADAAREFTAGLIADQPVRLQADPEDDNRDLYQRLLRYVYLPDGTLVNTELIRQGYGFAYTYFPFTKLEEARALEREAREAKRGLWGGCEVQEGENGQAQTNSAN